MQKSVNIDQLKKRYQRGENIIQYLQSEYGGTLEKSEMIRISYDLQSGSYIQYAKENPEYIERYTDAIAKELEPFAFDSILEVGCGESTTLANVLARLQRKPSHYFGFDISLSRLLFAKSYMQGKGLARPNSLFVGDLFNIPLPDDSIDVVYTSHSIEPNGGREAESLKELYRVTRKYLVLLEPCFELAHDSAKKRMQDHGYITKLWETAEQLELPVQTKKLFPVCANPENPTGFTLITKNADAPAVNSAPSFTCPKTGKVLSQIQNSFFGLESNYVYPVLSGIPCLMQENAVLSSHFAERS